MAELTKQAVQNALFSCPATSAFDDSDSSYAIAPRSTFSVGAIACTTKDSWCSSAIPSISYSSSYSESVFQNAFCAPAKLNQSFTNRNNQAVTNSKDGGTITSNGDGSVTFNFEAACAIDSVAQSITYSATGRWVGSE